MSDPTQTIPSQQLAPYRADQLAAGKDSIPAGTLVGRYVILHLAGSGGMSRVYAAYDPELDRNVAIKLLTGEAAPAEAQAKLRAEARAMAKFAHPNVLSVFDVGTYQSEMFLAMEYVEGSTLAQWLAAEVRDWKRVLTVFCKAGRGLAAAHKVGVIHQDFKPSNVMMAKDGEVRVVDFGLAQLTTIDAANRTDYCAPTRTVAGTPGYVAPERLLGQAVDARSDQFSFCVTLLRALGADVGALSEGSVRGNSSIQTTGSVPGWLKKALVRGAQELPADRFASMNELLAAISLERRRNRLQRVVAMFIVAVLGALGWAYQAKISEHSQICSGAAARLTGIWDEARRNEIRTAFAKTEAVFAEEVLIGVVEASDQYANAWTEAYGSACRATHVLAEQSERMLDLRMQCLASRLEEFGSLAVLLSSADVELVSSANGAVSRLTPLDSCADRAELIRRQPLPTDSLDRSALERARASLAEERARLLTNDSAKTAAINAALATAQRLQYPFVEAEALFVMARRSADPAVSEDLLKKALRAAIAADSRRLEAEIYNELINQVGNLQSRLDQGRHFGRLALASLEALSEGRARLEMRIQVSLGNLDLAVDRFAEARGRYLKAKKLAEQAGATEDPSFAAVYANLAATLGAEHQEKALAHFRTALEIQEKSYGRLNPALAPTLVGLAGLHARLGKYDEAIELARRCLDILERFHESDHRDMAYPLILTAQILNAADRPAEAGTFLRRALPLARSGFGENSYVRAMTLLSLGESLIMQRLHKQAGVRLEEVLTLNEAWPEPNAPPYLTSLRLQRARLWVSEGAYERARDEVEIAPEALENVDDRDILAFLTVSGQAYLGLGRIDLALPLLERANAMVLPERDLHLNGEARFSLARALWQTDRLRARDLARAAVVDLDSGGSPRTLALLADLRVWLSEHQEGPEE